MDEQPSLDHLESLYQFITGENHEYAHRAMADVEATVGVFRYPPIWEEQKNCAFFFRLVLSSNAINLPPKLKLFMIQTLMTLNWLLK